MHSTCRWSMGAKNLSADDRAEIADCAAFELPF
jgi:hypothetical protein